MRKVMVIILAILLVGVALAGCTEETTKKKNKPPVAEFTVSKDDPTHNEVITLDASASTDPDKKDVDILEFEWDMGDTVKYNKSKGNKVIEHFYKTPGTFKITLLVFDKKAMSTAQKNITVVNDPPSIVSFYPKGNVSIVELDTEEFGVNATDEPNQDPLTYQWTYDGSDLTGETSKNMFFTPAIDEVPGLHNISVRVSDGKSFIYQEWSVNIINKNQAPMIVSYTPLSEDVTIAEMATQSFTITADDPDDDPLTYSWFLDDIVVIGETGTKYDFQPDYSSSGSYTVRVDVSDGELIVSKGWNITVTNTNRPPVIASGTPSGATVELDEGGTIDFSITATDPDGDILSYSWTFDTGLLTGQVNASYSYIAAMIDAGDHSLLVTVSDGKGGTDTNEWSITVNNINQPPLINTFTPLTDPSVNEMEDQAFTVGASDPDGDSLSYQWLVNGTIVGGQNTAAYTFTPSFDMGGEDHQVGVKVTDPFSGEAWKNWTVHVVNVNRAPTGSATVNMTKPGVGLEVEFDASASSDPDNDVLSFIWSFGDGSTPQGGSVVTHTYMNPGQFTAQVVVSDGNLEDSVDVQVDVNISESWMSQNLGKSGPIAVADVDNDGTKEIVVGVLESESGGTYTGFLYIFDAKTYSQEFKSNNLGWILDIKIGNTDADAALEIVIGTLSSAAPSGGGFATSGNLIVIDGSTHSTDFDSGDHGRTTAVGIGDLNNDGTKEIIAGHSDYFGNVGGNLVYFGNVSMIEHDGTGWTIPWSTGASVGMATCIEVDDIDGDTNLDAVVGMYNYLEGATGNKMGSILNIPYQGGNYIIENNQALTGMVHALTIADPDKDSNNEAVVGVEVKQLNDHIQGYLYVLDGTLSSEYSTADVGAVTSVVVEDVDNDNINEIVFGVLYNSTEDSVTQAILHPEGYLYILNGNNHNQKFKSADIGGVTSLGVGNLDGDSTLEIVVGTLEKKDASDNYEGYVYVFFYNTSKTAFEQLWKSRDIGMSSSIIVDDVDSDGFMDFVFATSSKETSPFTGRVYVFSNKNRP